MKFGTCSLCGRLSEREYSCSNQECQNYIETQEALTEHIVEQLINEKYDWDFLKQLKEVFEIKNEE
jgi:hypothetical protein